MHIKINANTLLLHRYHNLLLNGQYFAAANDKYLEERYLNSPAAKQSSLAGTGGMRSSTAAPALSGCAPHGHGPQLPELLAAREPRAGALLPAANTSLPRCPFQTGWLLHPALEFNTQCPALTTGLSLQRKHRHTPKLPFFPRHKWRTPRRQVIRK